MITDLAKRFKTHSVNSETAKLLEKVKDKIYDLADMLDLYCPESKEKDLALTKLEECSFWVGACLSRNSERKN